MPNATFTSLTSDVYTITGRPDLVAETSLAVRAATLKLHQSDFYPRDLSESQVQFNIAGYYQALEYKGIFPYFRSLSYIRKFENNAPTDFLTIITPNEALDSYSVAKEDVCYLAGSLIQIRSSTQISYILMGIYQLPVTDPELYTSWIADTYPMAIITEAAATVFKMIGFDEQASMYKQLAGEQLMMVRNSSLVLEGF